MKSANDVTVHILHLHGRFDRGAGELRTVRLINAFGDRARHAIVSAEPAALGARAELDRRVKASFPEDCPALAGSPSVARYQALARYMRRFDLVLTHGWGAIDAVMARRLFPAGVPTLIHHEDGLSGIEAHRLKFERTVFRRIAFSAAHALVVPSRSMRDIALKSWKQPDYRVHCITAGVDARQFATRPDPRALPGLIRRKGEVVIGTIATLAPDRNLTALVRAVARLDMPARLVIVGDGPEREAIAAEASKYGVSLLLPGARTAPEKFLGLFDLYAIASRREQFPLTLVQAMAAGLPVAATDVGDVRLMVSAANAALLVSKDDEPALAQTIHLLAHHPAERARLGAENRAKAVTDHDEKAMIARFAALYGGAIGRSGALMPGG